MQVPDTLLKKIAVYRRRTWMPLIREKVIPDVLGCKIGGHAYVAEGEDYPRCPLCQQPLTLFLQINPDRLPAKLDLDLLPDQLIQLFYCTNRAASCELKAEAWQPFAATVLARQISRPAASAQAAFPSFSNEITKRQFPEKQVVDWVEAADYPDWHEMQLGEAGLSEAEVLLLENDQTTTPKAGDKLGGWPYWIQGVEYPQCPQCSLQMQMVFQLDSELNLPYMFGDSGIAHLYQCRLHKDQLAFSWAGY